MTVRIPADAESGEHKIAAYTEDGSLIGWDDIQVIAQEPGAGPSDPGDPDAGGDGTDTGAEPGGSGPAGRASGEDGSADGSLPWTGANTGITLIAAVLLIALGGLLLFVRRRRAGDIRH